VISSAVLTALTLILVLAARVISALMQTDSLQRFNDGLSAAADSAAAVLFTGRWRAAKGAGTCSLPYRVGDMIRHHSTGKYGMTGKYARCHADSIGGEYMRTAPKRGYTHNMQLLTDIVARRCGLAPTHETVVHLSPGDVLCNHRRRSTHPMSAESFSHRVHAATPATAPRVILYGDHSSCVEESNAFLASVRRRLPNTTVSSNAPADEDVCRMVNAETFVVGKGGLSEVAALVRDHLRRPSVRDPKLSAG
jgi:hypothetical protein